MTTSDTETKLMESPGPPALTDAMLTSKEITEMHKVDNLLNPLILPMGKVTANWTGHILSKDDGKWTDWSYSMTLELSMVQLWEYVFNAPAAPHPKLCADEWNPVALWTYLKQRHGGAIPVQQVCLLQEALTTKCSPSESLTKTADDIMEKIEHVFDAGEVTKELLQAIAILSALSNKSYVHI
ncbi:hypothetical protein C0989_002181 [Termitomyces sp. Mn162]|nr:hypothetical protein C0989_002181 [Termitomyces sp. Mn162]